MAIISINFSLASAQESELLIVTDEEKQNSYLVEITEKALTQVGYRTKIEFMPWKRALHNSMNGKADVLLGAYYNEKRAQKMLYSEPIDKVELVFLALKESNIRYTALTDLKPYTIGHIRGVSVNKAFDSASYLRKEAVTNVEQNIKKLISGRVDLIVFKKRRLLHLIHTKFPEISNKVELLSPSLQTSFFYNAFPKSQPNALKHLEDFNRGLRAIKNDGTYAKILIKHGIEE
jgi:polar amino acid transport system substrate-binding protein